MLSTHESARSAGDLPLLEIAWRGWRVLTGAVVVSAALGALVASWQSTLYESSATLLVAHGDDAGIPPSTSSIPNVRTLLSNRAAVAAVIAQFRLSQPPDSLTADELIVDRLRVIQIRDTNYVKASLRLESPDTAQKALASLIQAASTLNTKIETDGTTLVTKDLLKREVDDANRQLERIDQELFDLRNSVQLERLESEAEAAMTRKSRVLELDATIAAEQTRLAQAEKELAGRVRRQGAPSAGDEAAALPPARRNSPDPVYDALDYETASTRVKIESLKAERAVVAKQSTTAPLRDLYDARRRVERLEGEHRARLDAYVTAVALVEAAEKSTEARHVQVLMVDPPSAPAVPVAPRVWLSGALTGTLGFVGALLVLFAAQSRMRSRDLQLQP